MNIGSVDGESGGELMVTAQTLQCSYVCMELLDPKTQLKPRFHMPGCTVGFF